MRVFGLMILGAAGLRYCRGCAGSIAGADRRHHQKFAAKEAEFAKARENYTYHQTARIQELERPEPSAGKWETVSDIVFDAAGKRTEHVTARPFPR